MIVKVIIEMEREIPDDVDESYVYDSVRDVTAVAEMEGWLVGAVNY